MTTAESGSPQLASDIAPPPRLLGVRESSKQRTRANIVAESLRLFQQHGYDAVTTQQIAAEVGVTQRTLFRYFERKDSIIYDSAFDYVRRIEQGLAEEIQRSADGYAAVRAAFGRVTRYFDDSRSIIRPVYAIIQNSDELKGIDRSHQMRVDWLVACALDGPAAYAARIDHPTLGSRITASVLCAALRPVLRAWLTGELAGELSAAAEACWTHLHPLFEAAQRYAHRTAEEIACGGGVQLM